MPDRYPQFDRSRLELKPLASREHDLDLGVILALEPRDQVDDRLAQVAARLRAARNSGAARVLMMGAHVLRDGVQRYLIDLMERGYITCLALNGAGVIHDYEFALIGATTESVARYIKDGSFGMWTETGELNQIISQGAKEGLGLGEAVGKAILDRGLDHAEISVVAQAYRLGIPVTVHVSLGCDIIHQHPGCDGAAIGQATYLDFLRFAACLESLEHGVLMNLGSAVMGPEVYLKALSMVRNAARQSGESIRRFTTLVCDLAPLPPAIGLEPDKQEPLYYFRPWKTMLVRTVAEGGESFYVNARHSQTVPQLWTALTASHS